MSIRVYGRLRRDTDGGLYFRPAAALQRGAPLLAAVAVEPSEVRHDGHREGFDAVRVSPSALARIRQSQGACMGRQMQLAEQEKKPKPRTARTKVARIVELREQAGELYGEADALLGEVLDASEVGETFEVGGRTFEVVDNFVDRDGNPKLKAWKPAGIMRFDVVEQKPRRRGARK